MVVNNGNGKIEFFDVARNNVEKLPLTVWNVLIIEIWIFVAQK